MQRLRNRPLCAECNSPRAIVANDQPRGSLRPGAEHTNNSISNRTRPRSRREVLNRVDADPTGCTLPLPEVTPFVGTEPTEDMGGIGARRLQDGAFHVSNQARFQCQYFWQ